MSSVETIDAAPATLTVRSVLYPVDARPGFRNADGLWLPDFSCAGYRLGASLPESDDRPLCDVTASPYHADPHGREDATAAIQRALDDVGRAGGGVVFLPAGTYRLRFHDDDPDAALRVRYPNVILRGAGADATRLFLDETTSRNKSVLLAQPDQPLDWRAPVAVSRPLREDLDGPVRDIPLTSVDGLRAGDVVLLRNTVTEAFIDEHGMAGKWRPGQGPLVGITWVRRVVSVDSARRVATLDAPAMYPLKTRDHARLDAIPDVMLKEVGFEDFSIGMRENPDIPAWKTSDAEDFSFLDATHPTHGVHGSNALVFHQCENAYARRVHSYCPEGNAFLHVHSSGIRMNGTRAVTVADCHFANAQYRGCGGNGYLFTLNGCDGLLDNCTAVAGRHNIVFLNMHCGGNVVHRCRIEAGLLPSDFHMYLSAGNLVDDCEAVDDYFECRFRPYSSGVMHGEPGAGNFFWNIRGRGRDGVVVDHRQIRGGGVIGTTDGGLSPISTGHREWIGEGARLRPSSLWLDQCRRWR